jgi:hypothetical protein
MKYQIISAEAAAPLARRLADEYPEVSFVNIGALGFGGWG